MKRRHLIFFLLVLVTISSCNLPASPPTEPALPQPTIDIPVTGVNTPTPVPVETLVDEIVFRSQLLTPTPSMVLASPRETIKLPFRAGHLLCSDRCADRWQAGGGDRKKYRYHLDLCS